MHERDQYTLAMTAAETTYHLWELEDQQEGVNLDRMMRRLKDLSAYSLTHAEIMDQREGVELLALALFFGASSDHRFWYNQSRLSELSEGTVDYQGQAEVIEREVVERRKIGNRRWKKDYDGAHLLQPRLL